MKNSYLTGYMPLFSILLFSLSLSMYGQAFLVSMLKKANLYNTMLDIFTKTEINLAVIGGLLLLFTMVFATLKLLANTVNEMAFLFFSKDTEGDLLKKIRFGSFIYFLGGLVSLISFSSAAGIMVIFFLTSIAYLIYIVYKLKADLTRPQILGILVFEGVFWAFILFLLAWLFMKIYNSLFAAIPL